MLHIAEPRPASQPMARRRAAGLSSLIGRTPLLAIDVTYKGRQHRIYARSKTVSRYQS